jgi:hypothetical protein
MTDLHALHDAFAELERRADAASAGMPLDLAPRRQSQRRPVSRLVPVAVSALVVAGLAAGATRLAPGGNGGTDGGTQTGASPGGAPATARPQPSPTPPHSVVPRDPDDLAARFRVVLGGSATFTVTETGAAARITLPPGPDATSKPTAPGAAVDRQPNGSQTTHVGAAIVGTLTAGGVTGGYDLQIYPDDNPGKAQCDDPDRSHCTVSTLADGSTLAVGQERLENAANGVTYQVSLVRPDGVTFLMHVSNERSPKGASQVLAAHPPLTTDQLVAIVTSDRW